MNGGTFRREFEVTGGDFYNAGRVSTEIKEILRQIGIAAPKIRRLAIAAYEAEMNMVMYARSGKVLLQVTPEVVRLDVNDVGPGIENIELAMQEGYSTASEEMRAMGFGAGMGLPNIKKNADRFEIRSEVGKGTTLEIEVRL
ncbi:MAG: ATP-binding protein [Candidatus Sumerlaeia bacterium]|nr:ATP-binding protein [Candidatus Sumerlaeia bacterium]